MIIDAPKESMLPALRTLWQEAFGDTEKFLNTFFSTAFSADRCRVVVENDTAVAMLYWFDCLWDGRPLAYVYAVATAKCFRGQGLCHKLMEDTHRHLEDRGYAGTVLVPGSNTLFRFYEGMGYKAFGGIREFSCSRAKTAVFLTKLDKTEYAALRRPLLPLGAVFQEQENLDFLETQATFYKGPDFLLAARTEGNTLFGLELLGNETAAAGIVYSLGCKKGTFRTPGTAGDRPFAMYRPISQEYTNKKGGTMPTYFGFAFE